MKFANVDQTVTGDQVIRDMDADHFSKNDRVFVLGLGMRDNV